MICLNLVNSYDKDNIFEIAWNSIRKDAIVYTIISNLRHSTKLTHIKNQPSWLNPKYKAYLGDMKYGSSLEITPFLHNSVLNQWSHRNYKNSHHRSYNFAQTSQMFTTQYNKTTRKYELLFTIALVLQNTEIRQVKQSRKAYTCTGGGKTLRCTSSGGAYGCNMYAVLPSACGITAFALWVILTNRNAGCFIISAVYLLNLKNV